jgi:hypothetical protein
MCFRERSRNPPVKQGNFFHFSGDSEVDWLRMLCATLSLNSR